MSQTNTNKEADYKKLNITNEVTITHQDLPLHCPTNVSALWCAHPKVFLPIESTNNGKSICPYCGTIYILQD
jgi:uncharacterized Zn-finger protein